VKENGRLTTTTTALDNNNNNNNKNSNAPLRLYHRPQHLLHHQRQEHHFSESAQHASSPSNDVDLTKRKSPSIFSSVEELARGTTTTQATPVISPSPALVLDHVTSIPAVAAAQRSPLMFDLSADSGYGDSAHRDVTSGLDCTPEVLSKTIDNETATPLKMVDCRPMAVQPIGATAPVLRHQTTSVSATDSIAADASKSRLKEKLQVGRESSAFVAVAMETASSSQPLEEPQDSLRQMHGGYGVRNPHPVRGQSTPSTGNCIENENKLEMIHGGFGVKNPILNQTTDPSNGTSANFSKSQFDRHCLSVYVIQ